MTDTPKPLTADHIRVLKTLCEKHPQSDLARAIATIEQQREQIENLCKALEYCAVVPAELNPANQAQFMVAREALAATEPPK